MNCDQRIKFKVVHEQKVRKGITQILANSNEESFNESAPSGKTDKANVAGICWPICGTIRKNGIF